MESVQHLPKGILLYAHDYQLNASSLKRSVPLIDSLLPPTKRNKTDIGEDPNREHHYQELPGDIPEAPAVAVEPGSRLEGRAGEHGKSQHQLAGPCPEQQSEKQHQPQQAGDGPEAHFQDLGNRSDAGFHDCQSVKSQPERAEQEVKQRKMQRPDMRKRARDRSTGHNIRYKRGFKSSEVKCQNVQSHLDEANKEIDAEVQELQQQLSAGETTMTQYQGPSPDFEETIEGYKQRISKLEAAVKDRDFALAKLWTDAKGEHQSQMESQARGIVGLGEQKFEEYRQNALNEHNRIVGKKDSEHNRIVGEKNSEHNRIVGEKNSEIQKLLRQLTAETEAKHQHEKKIAQLEGDLDFEKNLVEEKKKQYEELHNRFREYMTDTQKAHGRSEGEKARKIRDLDVKCTELERENGEWKESYEQMEGELEETQRQRDSVHGRLNAVDALISKRQYERAACGRVSRRKSKETTAVKTAGKTAHSNSIVLGRHGITKSRKKTTSSVSTAWLRKPAVTKDLFKLVDGPASLEDLVQSAENFGLKGKHDSSAGVEETEEEEQEDEDSEDEAADERDAAVEFEEELLDAMAEPENDVAEDGDAVEEEAPAHDEMDADDAHSDEDPEASVPKVKVEEASQLDGDDDDGYVL